MLIKEKHVTRMGVGPLCKLFGKSRQAYYKKKWFITDQEQQEMIVLELIAQVRRELPGLGLHKLYRCIYQPLRSNNIKFGRDKVHTLLRKYGLLITKKRRNPKTTQSNHHWFRRYPDLTKELEVNQAEQLWVSDITYICIGYDFNYLSLITDAYSKKIMGYCLHPYLTNDGCIEALKMAIVGRSFNRTLIHHSDRGSQYCSYDYVTILKKTGIQISLTQNGEAHENPIAERVNGILKTEFNLNKIFKSRTQALLAVKSSIEAYNNLRPHMSCNYLTPVVAHLSDQALIKCWKNTRKKSISSTKNEMLLS
jgi:transposase InsO family protein